MQIWQLLIVIRQPITNLATVFTIPTNLTNDHFYLPFRKQKQMVSKADDVIRQEMYTTKIILIEV